MEGWVDRGALSNVGVVGLRGGAGEWPEGGGVEGMDGCKGRWG